MTDLKQASRQGSRREASETESQVDARIQEICDQLHRLEALISRTVALPASPNAGTPGRLVFFRPPFD